MRVPMTFDIHASVFDDENPYEEEAIDAYQEALLGRFWDSPECGALRDAGADVCWAELLLELAMRYEQRTPATLTVDVLEDLLFVLLPRKVACDPTEAEACVTELRAFWTFLAREFALPNADGCLALLDGRAASRLQAALADRASWGPAKALVLSGWAPGCATVRTVFRLLWVLMWYLLSLRWLGDRGRDYRQVELPPDAGRWGDADLASTDRRRQRHAARARKTKRKAARRARRRSRR